MQERQYARFPRAKLLRRLVAIQEELADWSGTYATRGSDELGPVFGHRLWERSNYLDHIWHQLEPARIALEDLR